MEKKSTKINVSDNTHTTKSTPEQKDEDSKNRTEFAEEFSLDTEKREKKNEKAQRGCRK